MRHAHRPVGRAAGLVLLLAAPVLLAQDLNLFEPTEAEPQQPQQMRTLDRAAAQQNGQPAFTLRSTARFGDEFHAVLIDRGGQPVQVRWRANEPNQVPGYESFVLTDVAAGTVTLQQPSMEPCIERPEQGVRCSGANVAVLQLSTAAPLQVNGTSPAPRNALQQPAAAGVAAEGQVLQLPDGGPQVVINPFSGEPEMVVQLSDEERAAREERQRARAERLQQMLEANRIDPADVRPGYRVVRTPFGDRQVPINE